MAGQKSDADVEKIEAEITEATLILQARLKEIDPSLITQLKIGRASEISTGHFSDWHDNWRDGPRWSKTWGKAGGKTEFDFEHFDASFRGLK